VLAGRHSLPGHGSSLAPATWALVDLSRSGCSPMVAPMPVATGSPPSAARSASSAAPPSHCFSLLRMPAMRRVYDVILRHDPRRPYCGLKPSGEKRIMAIGRGAGRLAVPKACTETPTPPGQTCRTTNPLHPEKRSRRLSL
jgi:hypothetical protein